MFADSLLSLLQSGWRPSESELASAETIQHWRLHAPGPYVLQGRVGDRILSGVAYALDAGAGWACMAGHWVRLGTRARGPQPVIDNAEIMRSAAAALARPADMRFVAAHARELSRQASVAGLIVPAYLMQLAARSIEDAG